uniref:Fucosyltransferase N-terminal domain-containing protein n=1 Tax=Biomphalaria glabrata TaxID=6526 RepID=A0A2C9KWR5_BIOGL
MLIIGVSAFFIDTLSENRILGVFIPAAFTQDKVQIYNNSQNNSLLGLGEMMETKTYHTTFSTQATSASTSLLMTTLISSTTTTTLSTSVTLISPQAAIEVHCSPSPYVDCDGSLMDESTTNETFGVVLLRRPGWMDISRFDFSKCQYSKCVFQGDTIDNTTRLIIIYTVGLNDNFKLSQRWPGQIYAAATWESPPHTHASFLSDKNSHWNFVFNVTATYRTDSEIFVPYARLIFQPTPKGKRPNYCKYICIIEVKHVLNLSHNHSYHFCVYSFVTV